MAIMALFRSPRVDQKTYDAIIQDLDLEHRPAAGAITHACGFDAGGICVLDVWESRKDFEAFLTERLKPTFARLKIDFVAPTIMDAYAFNATDEVDHHKAGAAAGIAAAASSGREQPGMGTSH